MKVINNLNTSYVEVKLIAINLFICLKSNLNTFYVEVKHGDIAVVLVNG